MKYGARHLKRAIDRSLVHPLSNLIATDQVYSGDLVRVDYDPDAGKMVFFTEAEGLPPSAMLQMVDAPVMPATGAFTVSAAAENPRATHARSSRR